MKHSQINHTKVRGLSRRDITISLSMLVMVFGIGIGFTLLFKGLVLEQNFIIFLLGWGLLLVGLIAVPIWYNEVSLNSSHE